MKHIDEKAIDEEIKWAKINEDVLRHMETPRKAYWVAFGACFLMFLVAAVAEVYQYRYGLGVADLNRSHMWGLYIATFIFWVGASHAGTLLSAFLHIIHAEWRRTIYRFAEAMTSVALMTAAIFPMIHLGRVWNLYWVVPYVSDRGIWSNFRSPLVWDAFAITTYLTCSLTFLYVGMIPDLAICRDNARGWRKKLYIVLSVGWQGTDRQWRNFRKTYMTMACFLLPLAISVHSVVSSDFAVSLMPGWHVTSFPPYFVAGALYSGCAGIITLFIIMRYFFRLEDYMTVNIMEKLCKMTFAIAMVWTYLILAEFAAVWYGHSQPDKEVLLSKFYGPFAPYFWAMMFLAVVLPFTLAFQKIRRNMAALMVLSILFNIGMWLERWMIVSPTLSHAFNPESWNSLWPSIVQWSIVFGSFGWFGMIFLIFCKIFPMVSMYEVKEMIFHQKQDLLGHKHGHGHAGAGHVVGKPSVEGASS